MNDSKHLAPHRGGLLLAFGIIGLVACPPFCIAAWVMAVNDLREMDAGRMDPTGRSLTEAGKVLGIVAAVVFVLSMLVTGLFFLVALGSAAVAN